MENKENKKPKGLIVLVVVLSILLCLSVGYICYDKFFVKNDDVTNNENGDNNELEKEENKVVSEKEVKKLFDNLLVGDYGLYYDRKVDIHTIDEDYLVQHAIRKYIADNNIDLEDYLLYECDGYNVADSTEDVRFCDSFDSNDALSKDKLSFVSKKDVNKILKDVFNLDSITIKDRTLYGDINSFNAFVYVEKDDAFYYYRRQMAGDGYISKFEDKMIDYKQVGDEIHIYSHYLDCSFWAGGTCTLSDGYDFEYYFDDDDVIVAVNEDYNNEEAIVDKKIKTSDGFNFDYIFEKYGDKMDKYKTVFKKASDGKYYWSSSELVR